MHKELAEHFGIDEQDTWDFMSWAKSNEGPFKQLNEYTRLVFINQGYEVNIPTFTAQDFSYQTERKFGFRNRLCRAWSELTNGNRENCSGYKLIVLPPPENKVTLTMNHYGFFMPLGKVGVSLHQFKIICAYYAAEDTLFVRHCEIIGI